MLFNWYVQRKNVWANWMSSKWNDTLWTNNTSFICTFFHKLNGCKFSIIINQSANYVNIFVHDTFSSFRSLFIVVLVFFFSFCFGFHCSSFIIFFHDIFINAWCAWITMNVTNIYQLECLAYRTKQQHKSHPLKGTAARNDTKYFQEPNSPHNVFQILSGIGKSQPFLRHSLH